MSVVAPWMSSFVLLAAVGGAATVARAQPDCPNCTAYVTFYDHTGSGAGPEARAAAADLIAHLAMLSSIPLSGEEVATSVGVKVEVVTTPEWAAANGIDAFGVAARARGVASMTTHGVGIRVEASTQDDGSIAENVGSIGH